MRRLNAFGAAIVVGFASLTATLSAQQLGSNEDEAAI